MMRHRDRPACSAADLSQARCRCSTGRRTPGHWRRRASEFKVKAREGMGNDIDRDGVAKAYARWAPIYDLVFGAVFEKGRLASIAAADRLGGRVLDVGVGTGLSLS